MALISNISCDRGKQPPSKLDVLNHITEYKSTIAILKSLGFYFKK